ncbi:MAG: hypothetical protein P8077_01650 [Gammaproteobacteria bacterium]
MAEENEPHHDSAPLAPTGKLTLPKRGESAHKSDANASDSASTLRSDRKRSGGRYVVTPKSNDRDAADGEKSSDKSTERRRRHAGAGAPARAARGHKNAGGLRRKAPQKKLPDDPDHQWLKKELKAAESVAHVIARKAQFENKIRALKLHHAADRPLYLYAERMEKLLQRLQTYPWTTLLRDIRRDDEVVKNLKL